MKDSLKPGLTVTRRVTATPEKCIQFMGEALSVYATPAIVGDMEYTARDMILDHLSDGQDSVGARVEIDHVAPTLAGQWADVTVTVSDVKGRRVSFDYTVRDAVEEVARGMHVRFVVDKDKTAERLAAKRAQV